MEAKKNVRAAICSPTERLFRLREIDEITGCWKWLGKISRTGYGVISITTDKKRKTPAVHRYAFSLFNNVVLLPHNIIHHKCHNRLYFNPDHLEMVTTVYNNLEKQQSWDLFSTLHLELINEYKEIQDRVQKTYLNWAKQLI